MAFEPSVNIEQRTPQSLSTNIETIRKSSGDVIIIAIVLHVWLLISEGNRLQNVQSMKNNSFCQESGMQATANKSQASCNQTC